MDSIEIPIENIRLIKAKAKEILNLIVEAKNNVVIVSLGNPDNLCATGILMKSFQQLSIGSHAIIAESGKNLNKRLRNFEYTSLFFIGFQINDIPKPIIEDKDARIVFINHEIIFKEENDNLIDRIHTLTLNQFDLPVSAISNSGLAYYIAEGFDEEYQKFAGLAIIGALNKKQVNPKNQELIGLNSMILDEGKREGYLSETKGTRIPGRENQPIHLALKSSIIPYFPGLTGTESACTSFVSRLGIRMENQEGIKRTIASLSKEETKKLNDELISLLMENKNQSLVDIYKLIGPIYILNKEIEKSQTRNAEEFLWLLDGACQLKKCSLALSVILGDRKNLYDQLLRELSNYHGKASQIIEEITNNPEIIENKTYFRVIDGSEIFDSETASLVINALIESSIIPVDLPLFVTVKEGKSKFLYVYESPLNVKKGFLIYHSALDLENQDIVDDIQGNEKFFRMNIDEDKFDIIIDSLEKSLIYHHEGNREEEEE